MGIVSQIVAARKNAAAQHHGKRIHRHPQLAMGIPDHLHFRSRGRGTDFSGGCLTGVDGRVWEHEKPLVAYLHLCATVRPDTYQSSTNAPRFPTGITARMDVRSYRKHHSRNHGSLGEQHGGIRGVQSPATGIRNGAHRPFWNTHTHPDCRSTLLMLHPPSCPLATPPAHEKLRLSERRERLLGKISDEMGVF